MPGRIASPDDLETVTDIIALSFAQDPVWGPALARADGRRDHRGAIWRPWLEGAMAYPWTWLAEQDAATSVWIPPGGSEMSEGQEERMTRLVREHLGEGADDYMETLERFDAAHPRGEPHYYLTLLGTHPEHRGHGTGMALLRENLELVDREGASAYLESTNPANDKRYESVGFKKVGEFATPYGAVVSTMWRKPRV